MRAPFGCCVNAILTEANDRVQRGVLAAKASVLVLNLTVRQKTLKNSGRRQICRSLCVRVNRRDVIPMRGILGPCYGAPGHAKGSVWRRQPGWVSAAATDSSDATAETREYLVYCQQVVCEDRI